MLSLRRCARFFAAIFLISILASPAFARYVPRVMQKAEASGSAIILVNNRIVIRLRTPNANLSPHSRAVIGAGRLAGVIGKGLDPDALTCKVTGESARLMAGDLMVLIATPSESKANGMSPAQLVNSWIRAIRDALALPPLSASPTELRVPLGETRTVAVESLFDSPVKVQVTNGAIVKAESAKPGTLVVSGLDVGDTDIKVQCEDCTVSVQVHVRKYAAVLSGSGFGVVTGFDAPASLIRRAAADAARSAVKLEPGASFRSVEVGQVPSSILPGKQSPVGVCVEAAGGDYIPARINAQVQVENRLMAQTRTSRIMYSNDPERVLKYQMLFTGQISPDQEAVRLLYHHQNMMNQRIGFVIEVLNPSPNPGSLHVIEGVSKPMVDTVIVGYKAGMEFLDNYRAMIGRVVDIPAGSRRVLVSQPLDHPYTASGILELRQLCGDSLLIRVIAKPEEQRLEADPPDALLPANGIDPTKLRMSDHIYPDPVQNLEVTYSAGKQWVFLRLGKDAIKHADQEKWLYGNYGVIYDIKATLENTLPTSQTVELVFEATAGPASGIFIIDGRVVPIKLAQPPNEISVGRFAVPEGSTRTVSIRTMPLSGSAYPATLIIRSVNGTASSSGLR